MISANEAMPHLWTDIIVWKNRKRRYLFAGDRQWAIPFNEHTPPVDGQFG